MKIHITGDSWVSGKKLDRLLWEELDAAGINSEITSKGYPGARSADVLRRLSLDREDALIVVCGVNDAIAHVGCWQYANGIAGMACSALKRGLVPFIVECPAFDVMGAVTTSKWTSRLKRWLLRWVRDGGRHDVVDQYRASALQVLPPGTIVVSFPQLGPEHYRDSSHLNAAGSAILVQAIAATMKGANRS